MVKPTITQTEIIATAPNVDLAKFDATTEQDIYHMRRAGYDPDDAIGDKDIISPAIIRKRLGLSQRHSPMLSMYLSPRYRTGRKAGPSWTRAHGR